MAKSNVSYGSGFVVLTSASNPDIIDRVFTCSNFTLSGGKGEYIPLKSFVGTDIDAFAGQMDIKLKVTAMDVSPLFRAYAANILSSYDGTPVANKTAFPVAAEIGIPEETTALMTALSNANITSGFAGVYYAIIPTNGVYASYIGYDAITGKTISLSGDRALAFSPLVRIPTAATQTVQVQFWVLDPYNAVTSTDLSQIKRARQNTIIFTSDNYQQSTNTAYSLITNSAILENYTQGKVVNEIQQIELEFTILNGDIKEIFTDTGYARG